MIALLSSIGIHLLVLLVLDGNIEKVMSKSNTSTSVITIILSKNSALENLPSISKANKSELILDSSKQSNTGLTESYLSLVRDKINKVKTKNNVAKQLDLKGEVDVEFRIVYPGKIMNLKLTKKSGFSPIDESAVETMNRVMQEDFPKMPAHLQVMKSLLIKVKIIYD